MPHFHALCSPERNKPLNEKRTCNRYPLRINPWISGRANILSVLYNLVSPVTFSTSVFVPLRYLMRSCEKPMRLVTRLAGSYHFDDFSTCGCSPRDSPPLRSRADVRSVRFSNLLFRASKRAVLFSCILPVEINVCGTSANWDETSTPQNAHRAGRRSFDQVSRLRFRAVVFCDCGPWSARCLSWDLTVMFRLIVAASFRVWSAHSMLLLLLLLLCLCVCEKRPSNSSPVRSLSAEHLYGWLSGLFSPDVISATHACKLLSRRL